VRSIARGWRRTANTPFNGPPLEPRLHSTLAFDLSDLRGAARGLGVSRNDLVVAAVAGAARSWLEARGYDGGEARLRGMVPVALRHEVEGGSLGNQISALVVDLPTEVDSPAERAQSVRQRIRFQLTRGEALGPIVLAGLAEKLGRWVLVLGRWLTDWRRSYNVVISSIPGPAGRLRLLDAELCTISPVIPLFRGQRFSVGAIIYAGRLHVGVLSAGSDQSALDAFARAIQRELHALMSAGDRDVPRREVA
jgi:hypothetical protein